MLPFQKTKEIKEKQKTVMSKSKEDNIIVNNILLQLKQNQTPWTVRNNIERPHHGYPLRWKQCVEVMKEWVQMQDEKQDEEQDKTIKQLKTNKEQRPGDVIRVMDFIVAQLCLVVPIFELSKIIAHYTFNVNDVQDQKHAYTQMPCVDRHQKYWSFIHILDVYVSSSDVADIVFGYYEPTVALLKQFQDLLNTRASYNGINNLLLHCDSQQPFWVAYGQMKQWKAYAKKGSKSRKVIYFSKVRCNVAGCEFKGSPTCVYHEDGLASYQKHFSVFNVDELTGKQIEQDRVQFLDTWDNIRPVFVPKNGADTFVHEILTHLRGKQIRQSSRCKNSLVLNDSMENKKTKNKNKKKECRLCAETSQDLLDVPMVQICRGCYSPHYNCVYHSHGVPKQCIIFLPGTNDFTFAESYYYHYFRQLAHYAMSVTQERDKPFDVECSPDELLTEIVANRLMAHCHLVPFYENFRQYVSKWTQFFEREKCSLEELMTGYMKRGDVAFDFLVSSATDHTGFL